MDPISLILLAINGVRTVITNPALGGGSSVKISEASELLGLLGMLIEEGDDAIDDLRAFTSLIEDMAARGRAPSPEEWAGIRARSDDAHDRLQAVKEELLGSDEEEEPEAPTAEPTVEIEAPTTESGEGDDETVAPV